MRNGGLCGCGKNARITGYFFDNRYSRFGGDNQERISQINSERLTETASLC